MNNIFLTQDEADYLLYKTPKFCTSKEFYLFPLYGGNINIPLVSDDKSSEFLLDISRGKINLKRVKYQSRVHRAIVLARIDLDGPNHRNPDGAEIACPHIHIYKEGFDYKWAYPIPIDKFTNLSDYQITLDEFMNYCLIVEKPNIKVDLFI